MTTDPRYPIGKFERPAAVSPAQRRTFLDQIAAAPALLRKSVHGLTDAQLDTAYRDGGWTVRQVVHHIADSHVNAYVRCKLALTELDPPVKAYQEADWAELPDARQAPVEQSVRLLESLHERWVACLRAQPEAAFHRTVQHSENGRMTLDLLTATYAWHGAHHTAHITDLRKRQGW